jgi:hypothetical protein
VVGIGPWKDTVMPPTKDNLLATPTDLVAMAHPYTDRNENKFLHFDFRQDPLKVLSRRSPPGGYSAWMKSADP